MQWVQVEEFRDLTLEKMLQEGGMGEQMRPRVTDLEPCFAREPTSGFISTAVTQRPNFTKRHIRTCTPLCVT